MKYFFRLLLLLTTLSIIIISCEEKEIIEHGYDQQQLAAGRIAGTWEKPFNIKTPKNVPAEVFGEMRLLFTTDEDGIPAMFIAKGCPIVFSSEAGEWNINVADGTAKVNLKNVVPVDEFVAKATSTELTISFHMGWENTETGETGEGDFSATLLRQ